MPSHGVGDACYGGIEGITYYRIKHLLLSWKVSERPLVGIVINIPPVLQCTDSNIKYLFNNYNQFYHFTSTSTKSFKIVVFTMVLCGGSKVFHFHLTSTFLKVSKPSTLKKGAFKPLKRIKQTPRKVALNPEILSRILDFTGTKVRL